MTPDIERQEAKFILFWTLIILGLSSIPYICGYLFTPPKMKYMWLVYLIRDQNPYISWMRQAAEGKFFFQIMYTPEVHQPHLIFVFFLILGFIAKIFHLPLIFVYHFGRYSFAVLLLLSLYYLISMLLKQKNERKLAFLLAGLGAGFGWVVVIIGSIVPFHRSTIDLYVPEATVFTSILMSPLYTAAIFLLLVIFIFIIKGHRSDKIIYFVYAGISCFVLAFVHPYDVVTAYGVSFVFLLVSCLRQSGQIMKKIYYYSVFVAVSIPPMLYNFYVVSTDPVFQKWKDQISEPTGNLLSVAFGFGVVFFLGIYGFRGVKKSEDKDDSFLFLVTWAVVGFILIYSPIQIQRRLLLGLHVPLAILAGAALYKYILPSISKSKTVNRMLYNLSKPYRLQIVKKALVIVTLILAVPTNFYIVGRILKEQGIHARGYLKKEDIEALRWLEANSNSEDVVLSGRHIGNFVPRVSGNRVFIGYSQLTANFWGKIDLLNRFFKDSMDSRDRVEILKKYGVHYIYYGEREKKLGEYNYVFGKELGSMEFSGDDKVDLYEEPYLEKIFQNNSVTIFRVFEQRG